MSSDPGQPDATAQLDASGRRLVDALRDQLADGQVETLLSLGRADARARQSAQQLEAAAESLTREVTDRIAEAGEALIRLADDIWVQLSAAAARLAEDADATVRRVHEQARAAEQGVATTVQDTVTALEGQMDASLRRAAATSELVRLDLAGLLTGWESRDDARDKDLVGRGNLMLTEAAERLAAETERLAQRDREQERSRAEEFARVLDDVLARSGVRGRKVRGRVLQALQSDRHKDGVVKDGVVAEPAPPPAAAESPAQPAPAQPVPRKRTAPRKRTTAETPSTPGKRLPPAKETS